MTKFLDKYVQATSFLAGIVLVLMAIHVTADVVGKQLFGYPIPATLEFVSSYYMVAIVFLPLGAVTLEKGHLIVELFTQGLTEGRIALLTFVASTLAAAYVVAIFWFSFQQAVHATQTGEVWETANADLPTWIARWFVPIGCFGMLAQFCLQAIRSLNEVRNS